MGIIEEFKTEMKSDWAKMSRPKKIMLGVYFLCMLTVAGAILYTPYTV